MKKDNGQFKPGRLSWQKNLPKELTSFFGKKHTDETKLKMSIARKGIKCTDETKKKMSECKKGNIPWNKGKKNVYSEETLKKMSIKRIGKKHTDETKLKMSIARKGENNVMYGKKHTEETKNVLNVEIVKFKNPLPLLGDGFKIAHLIFITFIIFIVYIYYIRDPERK